MMASGSLSNAESLATEMPEAESKENLKARAEELNK